MLSTVDVSLSNGPVVVSHNNTTIQLPIGMPRNNIILAPILDTTRVPVIHLCKE